MNKLFKLGIFLLIFLNLLPAGFARDTVDLGHFFSSIHMFEYVSKHGFQYGLDIIDNVGPYGYLHYPYVYAGGAFWSKMAWFSLVCFVYAYSATSLAERIRPLAGKLFFLFSVIFFPFQSVSPFVSFEIIPRFAIFFSAIYFITDSNQGGGLRRYIDIIFSGLFYAFLVLEKASNVYYLGFLVLILSAYWVARSQWRSSILLIASFLLGIVAFWFAAGQHFSGLPIYFESMWLFISAYQENLLAGMDERNFNYALFYCGIAVVLIILRLRFSFALSENRKQLPVEVFRSAVAAALFFLTWKHGMLRGLPSYGTFLYTVPILFAYLFFYPVTDGVGIAKNMQQKWLSIRQFSIMRNGMFLALLVIIWSNIISVGWSASPSPDNSYNIKQFSSLWGEFRSRFTALTDFRPAESLAALDGKLERLKLENALPPYLKKVMHAGGVDEFGSAPEIIFLNDLNYHPRPVPINFIASTASLDQKNGLFYNDISTAPDFVLLEEFGLRLADGSAYLSLLFNYQAIATFKNWLVLKKRSGDWRRFERQKLTEREADFGEWISLATLQKSFLWMEIEAKPSLLGKVKRFLYKPDLLRVDIALDDGTIHSLPVSMAQLRGGFLLNPVIQTKKDVLMIAHDKSQVPWNLAKAFRISMDSPEKSRLFEKKFKFQFSEVGSSSLSDSKPALLDSSGANSLINLFAADFPVAITKFPLNLLSHEPHDDIVVTGLSGLESNGKESWRWALGPATHLKFYMDPVLPDTDRQLLLKFAFKNGVPIPDQTVTIRLNGKDVGHFTSEEISSQELTHAEAVLTAQKGVNLLEIVYQDWNHGKKHVGANDPRKLAVVVMRLSLQQQHK